MVGGPFSFAQTCVILCVKIETFHVDSRKSRESNHVNEPPTSNPSPIFAKAKFSGPRRSPSTIEKSPSPLGFLVVYPSLYGFGLIFLL